MFIDQGSFVDVVDGPLAGRRGVVRKIRIEDQTGAVLVGVDLINPGTGGFDLMLFAPLELKRTKLTPAQLERMHLIYAAFTIEREEMEAAAGVRS